MANTAKSVEKIYYLIVTCLGIALLGIIPYAKYLIYILPVFVLFSAFALGCLSFNFNRVTLPFLILLVASLPTAYAYNFDSFKKLVFLAAFTSIFLFVDFSKVRLNFYYLICILLVVFAFQILHGDLKHHGDSLNINIMESTSTFESSVAFPFALLACFFILQSRWLLAGLCTLLVFLALKRIAIIAIIVTLIARFIPKKLRKILVNPYLVIAASISILYLSIHFAYGGFDEQIKDFFDRAPNDLSKGRQRLWYDALTSLHYSFTDFILYGAGIGKAVTAIKQSYGVDRLLLHNDLLTLLLEYGLIVCILFIFYHLKQKTYNQRIVALALLIMLITDNVIIYQHVMLTYMLIQFQLARKESPG